MRHGKKYRSISAKIARSQSYSPEEAFKLIKEGKIAKFDESVEAHVRLGIDTKKGEQQVRGAVVLPHGVGKEKKIAVITSTKSKEAKSEGAGSNLRPRSFDKSGSLRIMVLRVPDSQYPRRSAFPPQAGKPISLL